jgi:2-hydroxychromene-2-carboxylate isomerase
MPCQPNLLARMLGDLLCEAPRPGETPRATAARWLRESEPGRRFTRYLADEARLLAMAANRLNLTGDDDLREIASALGAAARRLWHLAGTPPHARL